MCSGFFTLLLLTGVINNFKLLTVAFFFYFIVIAYFLNNALLSAVLSAIFAFPLFSPNKYYIVEVIRGMDFVDIAYRGNDYSITYGLNITNILLLISGLLFIRDLHVKKQNIKSRIKQLGLSPIIGLAGFLGLSHLANSIYSPFVFASATWSIQYSQMFIVAILIVYLYRRNKLSMLMFYPVIFSSAVLQFILSLWQFIKQSSIGLPIEIIYGTWFAQGLDENNALLRTSGSMLFHNQLALVSIIYLVVLLPRSFDKAHKFYLFGCIFAVITIFLTQSRSVWIALSLILILFVTFYRKELLKLWKQLDKKRLLIYGSLFSISVSYIIIPRILLSFNAVYEGAGLPIRLKLLSEGIQAFLLNPWIGYGVGTNEYVLHSLFPNGVMSVFPTAQHMGLLQLALEVGVFGLLFFMLPIYSTLRRTIISISNRSFSTERKSYQFTFLSGILAFFVYYLFLPHVGIIEFSYLGLILGFGLIGISK